MWYKYDYDDKDANPLPPAGELVYILETYYIDGVDMGYWDDGWWCHWSGSDDVGVVAWHPFEFPAVPQHIIDWEKQIESRYSD